MCLLNGECTRNLPTSITFHEYDQIIRLQNISRDPRYDKELESNNYTIYAYQGLYYTWTKEYDWQRVENTSSVGTRVHVPQRFYDIIQTLVCNYGGEALSKIFINDIPLEIKQIVRYKGTKTLYYNKDTGVYTTNSNYITDEGVWRSFLYNEDIGYIYTDFVYQGKLISNIGDNICRLNL